MGQLELVWMLVGVQTGPPTAEGCLAVSADLERHLLTQRFRPWAFTQQSCIPAYAHRKSRAGRAHAAVVMTTLGERPMPSSLAFVRFIKVLFWLLFADSLVLFLSWFRTSTTKRVKFNKTPSRSPGAFCSRQVTPVVM